MMSEELLLVLSICEGRYLPAPPGYSVLAEAKFDHQILQSDPVTLTETPDFNTELVWETDRKALQLHRLHKNPVKVEFYATCEAATDLRQLLGYVVLDTRAATEREPGEEAAVKWHRMLGCRPRSSNELPSVQLGLSLEPNVGQDGGNSVIEATVELTETLTSVAEEPSASEEAAAREPSSLAHSPPTRGPPARPPAPPLVPVLDDRLGCFQLGPAAGPQEVFTLTVIVVYAQHLQLLIPPDVELPSGTGFNFYYSLLDCDITTDPFHNIMQPSFLAERAVTRVRCQLPVLRQYLHQLESIDVHLCCGQLSLGTASVPVQQFVSSLTSLPAKPLVHEALHPLTSSLSGRTPRDPSGRAPAVGVAVELSHARVSGDGQSQLGGAEPESKPAPPPPPAPPADSTVELDDTALTGDGARVGSPLHIDSSGLSSDVGSADIPTVRPVTRPPADPAPVVEPPPPPETHERRDMPTERDDGRPRHYRFVLDLRKLRLDGQRRGRAVLRFSYPHFGDASELRSAPVPLSAGGPPLSVPRGSFEFNFAASPAWLGGTLRRFPLTVRVETEAGEPLGTAQVRLHSVLQQTPVHTSPLGVPGYQQSHLLTTEVTSPDGAVVGQLTVAMSVDDLGPAADEVATVAPPCDRDEKLDREMYAATRELEQWKQEQKLLFQNQLQQREAAHLATLTEEWKRRDAERELNVQKRLREALGLEEKLRAGVAALEERERQLKEREDELDKLRGKLQEEHQEIAAEVKSLTSEMEAACQQRIREEQQKTADAEAAARRLQEKADDLERRLAELQAQAPAAEAPSERAELERRLEAAVRSKLYYKQRWVETAAELEERRAADTRAARQQLEKEKLELDRLRAQVTARDETSFLSEERRLLEELRGQVRALTPREPPPASPAPAATPTPTAAGHAAEQLRCLQEERRVLMDTGLYTDGDAAVRELDRRISQLAAAAS